MISDLVSDNNRFETINNGLETINNGLETINNGLIFDDNYKISPFYIFGDEMNCINSEETIKSTRKMNINKKCKKIINDDNRLRQAKHILINSFIKFINKKIKKVYNNNIGNGINLKQILKIDYSKIKYVDIKSISEFMNTTLKDFFSLNINSKFTYFPRHFNKKVIEGLLKEKNAEKRENFINIFNKTFREWAQYLVEEKDELTIIFDKELKSRNKEFFKETIKNLINEIQCKKSRERKNIK